MLDERHLKAIEMLVEGTSTITAIAKEVRVSRRTLYDWMAKDDFKAKLHELQTHKDNVLREKVKGNAEENIKALEKLRDSSANDMVKYNAANQLLNYAGWSNNQVHEVTIKQDDNEQKNHLLDLLNEEQKEEE